MAALTLHAKATSEKVTSRPSTKIRACAECRRLKLRCDKIFPCQACVRRGCSALCPDKCFTSEATPSSLKANSLRSQAEIQVLKSRVAALEEALATSNPSHPLLSPANILSASENAAAETNADEAVDMFATLSISEDGSTVFHGATTMSHYFTQNKTSDSQFLRPEDQTTLPSNIQLLSVLFPFPPQTVVAAADPNDFLPFLPPAWVALDITDRYWHHFSIGSAPISRLQFMKNVYEVFYPFGVTKASLARSDAHRLGLLFITLALGVLTDLSKPMMSVEAETYHQLARAALSLDPVCDNTTLACLQCMLSMNFYLRAAPIQKSSGYLWAFNGIILKLASSVGILRDSRKWISDVDEIEQREVVCWEIICVEVWQAFIVGRPCNLDLTLVNCPQPPETATSSAGLTGFCAGYVPWKYRLHAIINKILLVALRPEPVNYSEILAIERQLRDCEMPPELIIQPCGSPFDDLPQNATTLHVQRFTALMLRETASCLLHRRFLVMAVQKQPDDPMSASPFHYSAVQAARSACCMVHAHIAMYRRYPELVSRTFMFWSMSFSAAVVLGIIAARYGDRDFALPCVNSFEQICALFQEAAGTSVQPYNASECLKRLQQRVGALFPGSVCSASTTDLEDLYLLGSQSLITTPSPEKDTECPSGAIYPCEPFIFPTSHHDAANEEGTAAGCLALEGSNALPHSARWPTPDSMFGNDDNPWDSPFLWPGDGAQGQTPGIEGPKDLSPGDDPTDSSRVNAEQWDQFLDNLGL